MLITISNKETGEALISYECSMFYAKEIPSGAFVVERENGNMESWDLNYFSFTITNN